MPSILAVPSFGGGVVLEGSADVQRTDEVQAADSYDIGRRGQLVAASDLSTFADISTSTNALNPVFALEAIGGQVPFLVGIGSFGGNQYVSVYELIAGGLNAGVNVGAAYAGGVLVTFASFPYVMPSGAQQRLVLVCIGARAAWAPRTALGLFAVTTTGAHTFQTLAISNYDALGTGSQGEFPGGTHAVQLYPRWIIAYNNFAFLFCFDNHDATTGDGPTRVMFSNIGNPIKYGLDPSPPPAVEVDRAFTDSDAFTLGGSGEIARGGCVWNGKLFVGTNRGLHYIEGFGRESFLSNGALPLKRTRNVIGPNAMIEGPDGLLYGVADDVGLWSYDGQVADPLGMRLRNFASKSLGYWDLIWTDTSQTLLSIPGQTNQDFVWMLSDPETMQVWVVIPYCNASTGFGIGTDTVVVKYHVLTGGFTRQVFTGKTLLRGTIFQRDQQAIRQRFIPVPGGSTNMQRYAYKANAGASPVLCATLPTTTLGEYAPHGPDGIGVSRKLYLTLSWESASALPLVFSVQPTIDQKPAGSAITLSIQTSAPGAPSDGDVWVDTSGTDTNLGNGTGGSIIPASPNDYLVKRWAAGRAKWDYVPSGGQQGTRISVPIAYTPARGSRVKYAVSCTSAAGRWQIEGLGIEPSTIRSDR